MTDLSPKPKLAAKRKRIKKKMHDDYDDEIEVKKRLSEKFSKKKKSKEDDTAVLKVRTKDDKTKVKVGNSESHNNVITRAEETHCAKQYQLELRPDALSSEWKCATCGIRSNRGTLGDLFGPYYVKITTENWPTFLVKKKPNKNARRDELWVDVWLHGDCALWTPGVQMEGSHLKGLEDALNKAWGEKCTLCGQMGANICTSDQKMVHYPCALKQGWSLDSSCYVCSPIRKS